MVYQVGGLPCEGARIVGDGSDHRLCRLLAELLGAALRASLEQLLGVGVGGTVAAPCADGGRQALQHIVGHDASKRVRAFASCAGTLYLWSADGANRRQPREDPTPIAGHS